MDTKEELKQVTVMCRDVFTKKTFDYGASWRIMRPESVTDQIYIKANRIRSLQLKGESLVGEGIIPEFVGIVNYGIMGLIQLKYGYAENVDMSPEQVVALYDQYIAETLALLEKKNHDYDEAWRGMRVSSYTDFILTKIERVKEIENHGGETLVSEGIASNYMDIINYAVFGVIKLGNG